MSDIAKLRSSDPKIRIVRAVVELAKITDPFSRPRQIGDDVSDSATEAENAEQKEKGEKENLEAIRRAEYLRGVADGRSKIEDILLTDYAAKLLTEHTRIEGTVNEVREQLSVLYRSSEEAIVKFAFGIAERIIRREVSLDRSIVLSQIGESVRRVLGVERITIRVHPHDLAAVREQKSAIQANGDSIREIVVEADEGLEPGDSVLESDMGNIDARIATQLKQIETMLFEGKVVS